MAKSKQAFRTISEVSDWLETPAHVLRFWESKFKQIKPIKRAGARRYYRPDDMKLIGGIKTLLHEQGLSIKEAQERLKSDGIKAVAGLSKPLTEVLQESQQTDAARDDGALFPQKSIEAPAPCAPPRKLAPAKAVPSKEQLDLFSTTPRNAARGPLMAQIPTLFAFLAHPHTERTNQTALRQQQKALVKLLENHGV